MLITELNSRKIFKHSHEINFARHSLSALSLDIFYTIISQIKNEDNELNEYVIDIKDLEKKMKSEDYSKRLYRGNLSKAADELMSQKVKIMSGDNYIQFHWFDKAVVNEKEHFIHLRLNQDLKEHLLNLEKYVKGDLKSFLSLKSKYSKRIYTIACQYLKMKKVTLNLSELQDILELSDSIKSKYSNFKDRVLKQAIKEINESSDINISYKEIKTGRAVTKIEFIVSKKSKNVIEAEIIE